MDNFKDYILEQEDEEYENQFNESAAEVGMQAAASVLGIGALGLLAVFGGSLLVLAYSKGLSKIASIWYRIGENFRELKGRKVLEYLSKVRKDPLVKQEVTKSITNKREYEDVLKEVYEAIEKKDFITAKEKYDALTPSFRKMPAVKQIIINSITRTLGEPPMWPPSPGNHCYKSIRNVLGLAEAKAAALSVSYSAIKTMGIEKE